MYLKLLKTSWKKFITPATVTLATLCVCVFGYVSLRSALLSFSIDYYELIDARFVASGILYLCLVLLVAFPTIEFYSNKKHFYDILNNDTERTHWFSLSVVYIYYLLKHFMFLCVGLHLFETFIIQSGMHRPIIGISATLQLQTWILALICLFVVVVRMETNKSIKGQVINNILLICIIAIYIIFLISYPVAIAIAIYTVLVAYFAMLAKYPEDLVKRRRVLPILALFLSLTSFAIVFGVYVLPLVRPELSPFSNRSAEIYFKPNMFLENSPFFNTATISGCIVFDTNKEYYLVTKDSQDNKILRIDKEVIAALSYNNRSEEIDHCHQSLLGVRVVDKFKSNDDT